MDNPQLPQEQYLQTEEIQRAFFNQLHKDASMAGIEVEITAIQNLTLKEVIQSIEQLIQKVIHESSGKQKIQSWLYRTDVSEKQITNVLHTPNSSYSKKTAELIVKRTLQKVILRYLHKHNKL